MKKIILLLLVAAQIPSVQARQSPVIYDESKVPEYTLPDPLVFNDGSEVTGKGDWERRRKEIYKMFEHEVYGVSPAWDKKPDISQVSYKENALGGIASRREVMIHLKNAGKTLNILLLLYLPHSAKPAPVFLGYNFYGNHTITSEKDITLTRAWVRDNKDYGITGNRATEASRGVRTSRWPLKEILSRGYGLATLYYGDVDPDFDDGFRNGVHSLFNEPRDSASWGSIAGWAWGLSRVMDYLETVPEVDQSEVFLIGHSRLGKTALWAGASDQRFAMVISNESGCGGAALSRRKFGETVERINKSFPHWFCSNFKKYNDKEENLPVDQHELIALIAPRPVYVASAAGDLWSDPRGEFLGAKNAGPVYHLFGLKGVGVAKMPAPEHPVGDFIGYHMRTGKHDLTRYDWEQYLDFADRHFSQKVLWQIGKADNSDREFALAPSGYDRFLEKDFGWEDRFFLVGDSDPAEDWPYAMPGAEDKWGGSASIAGWRASVQNILFGLDKLPENGKYELIIDLLDMSAEDPPLFKVTVNDSAWKYQLPKGSGDSTLKGAQAKAPGYVLKIPIPATALKKGGNEIRLSSLWGSWLVFDQVRMEGPADAQISVSHDAFIRNVKAADYEITDNGKHAQPLLIDVQHLSGEPLLEAFVDGQKIFQENIEKGRYVFEAPMPAVTSAKESHYEIKIDHRTARSGSIERSPQKSVTPADYVDTKMGTAHSRWMIAPGPWMPFGMVKISPDNQNAGWQSGYDPIFENIGGFSHIHEWTMSGLSMLPVNGPLVTKIGDQAHPDEGYRSRIDKQSEEAPLGYYKVRLTDYNITAELTATTRCSFQRYTFPKEKVSRVLIDFSTPAEYDYELQQVEVTKVSDHRIEGFSKQKAPGVWGKEIDQDYTVHFVIEFDQPIKLFGSWTDSSVQKDVSSFKVENAKDAGIYVEFNTTENPVVQVRTGISYVSVANAGENLTQEISEPFGWDFNAVRKYNIDTWNELFNRVKIATADRREKLRFYTNMYRALCSRNIFSDVDGSWVDATEDIQKLQDPDAVALGCDAFWNTFWNLNQFWNLVTPEWSSRWVRSQLAMYDANGALAKGPAGMEYIPVMVAEHEIPLIVGAYQMGIRNFDVQKAYEAVKKMETVPAYKIDGGLAGNRDLEAFLKYKYVPYDKGRFSNTLEYAYDNWTVAQFAQALGKTKDYRLFSDRGSWWKNAINAKTGYAQLRKSDGDWMPDFDPFRSGANEEYVEGNAWQLTYFVPQDVPGLIKRIGADRFISRLKWGFEQSDAWRFNAPGEQYWKFPVVQGNQQSMQFAFLFNWADRPWLTQKWSRAILDRYYGYGLSNAYLGDEDQGQMSAWFIMAAIGLFQTDGGCSTHPIYEIASPLYKKVTIDLGNRFGRGKTFTIEARHASRKNMYVQSATLNGKKLESCMFPASELLKGGELILEMGPEPDKKWGLIRGNP